MKKVVNRYVAGDPDWSLVSWQEFIQGLIDKYGLDAKMITDAGANNVDLVVLEEVEVEEPKKKKKIKCSKCGK